MLRAKLHPVPAVPDEKELRRLISALKSQRFVERQAAASKVTEAGTASLPTLRQALRGNQSANDRQQLQRIIQDIENPHALTVNVQSARAIEVLENLKTTEARELLRFMAGGRADEWVTRDAKAALARLESAR
jgi:hypothetical protein